MPVQPAVGRGVLMQEHADHRPPGPLAPVFAAPRGRLNRAGLLQIQPGRRVAELVAVALHELVVEMPHGEPGIVLVIEPEHPLELVPSDARLGEGRPRRRSSRPSGPSSSYRPRQRRKVRSLTPSAAAAASLWPKRPSPNRSRSSSKRMTPILVRIPPAHPSQPSWNGSRTGQVTRSQNRPTHASATRSRKGFVAARRAR